MSNMGQYGRALAAYAAEYQDRLASYTWQPDEGPYPTPYEDLRRDQFGPDTSALFQATHIIRTKTGWDEFPIPQRDGYGWLSPIRGGHLPVLDFLDTPLIGKTFACPEDRYLVRWQRATQQNLQSPWEVERQWPSSSIPWGFTTTYMNVPHLWTNDHAMGQNTVNVSSDGYWGFWRLQNNGGGTMKMIGRRRLSQVAHPSSKISTYDEADRHHSRKQILFLYDDARAPYLFFDGSVRVYGTTSINGGCSPFFPSGELRRWPVRFNVSAASFLQYRIEPPSGQWERHEFSQTRFVSTRNGLLGVDVGGSDVSR
jgi:hypothetical protein